MNATALIALVSVSVVNLSADDGFQIVERCLACHGGTIPAAGLNLTTREAALAGGRSGPALVPPS